MNSSRVHIFFCLILFGVLVFFSLFHLKESPPLWYDEGIYDQLAINIADNFGQNIQLSPTTFISSAYVTGGFPFLWPIALSIKMFGIGVMSTRMVMVIFMLLTVICAFVLLRKLFGIKSALISSLLLVTFPVFYGIGKNVLGEVPGIFYFLIFIFCLSLLENKLYKNLWLTIFTGLSLGLCVSSKPIFILSIAAIGLVFLANYKNRPWKNWKILTIGFLSFLLPISVWLTLQFGHSDKATKVLGYYANPYGIANIYSTIIDNIYRVFHEPSVIYFALFMVVWSLAIILRKKNKISNAEIVSFIFSILMSLAYLRTAGWYRYFFVAEFLAIMFFFNSLQSIWVYFEGRFNFANKKKLIVNSTLIFVIVCLQIYQLIFASWVAESYSGTKTANLEKYFLANKGKSYFLFNVPELAIFIPDHNYYQYLSPTETIVMGLDKVPLLLQGIPDILIYSSHSSKDIDEKIKKIYKNKFDGPGYIFLSK